MPKVKKSALVPYSAEQMYRLVDNIPEYVDFLPWCGGSEEVSREEDTVIASVSISKGAINKTFTTKNSLKKYKQIKMELVDGPFKTLEGCWLFEPIKEDACKVTLNLDYEFSNRILGMAIGPIFNQVANEMVDSFIKQARVSYD